MKIEDLFEMPDFINKEMPVTMSGSMRFYSEDTIAREFDIIGKVKINDEDFWSILKKDKSFAVIGVLGVREDDNKSGLQLIGQLDFKEPDLAFDREIKTPEEVLQVDSVQVFSKSKFQGIGYNLYLSLVEYGYIIVSDHTQYTGGKKLWEKIARSSASKKFEVYVIDNGHPIVDGEGKPLKYDGTNLADEKIWKAPAKSAKESTRYVLLMMKKKNKFQ